MDQSLQLQLLELERTLDLHDKDFELPDDKDFEVTELEVEAIEYH